VYVGGARNLQVGADLGVLRSEEENDEEDPECQGSHRAHVKLQRRRTKTISNNPSPVPRPVRRASQTDLVNVSPSSP
jgi:hypothetical protein